MRVEARSPASGLTAYACELCGEQRPTARRNKRPGWRRGSGAEDECVTAGAPPRGLRGGYQLDTIACQHESRASVLSGG